VLNPTHKNQTPGEITMTFDGSVKSHRDLAYMLEHHVIAETLPSRRMML
jgi:hypothetical protein